MLEKYCCSGEDGLAMASVPKQKWCEPYDWETALAEGTIFPCLNMPFFKADTGTSDTMKCSSIDSKARERENLMSQIAGISFAINDLTLYLDTHPDCPDGTPLFYQLLEERMKLLADYAAKYNPLTQISMVTGELDSNCFGWSEGPLPWEGGCI